MEVDLAKYPELNPFVKNRVSFTGHQYDFDTGVYEFHIKTAHRTADSYFSSLRHNMLEKYMWDLKRNSGRTRVYEGGVSEPDLLYSSRVELLFEGDGVVHITYRRIWK